MLVTQDSLEELNGFATDEFIRRRLQELWIVPVLFEGVDEMCLGTFRDTAHPEEYFEQYQAEVANHRRILVSENFQNVLTHCVAQFENLSTIGLRSLTMAYRTASHRESSPRCLGLRSLQKRVPCHRGSMYLHIMRHNKTTIGRDHALVLSALLKAATASHRPLKRIDMCNDFHLGCTAAALNLKSTRESLLPIIRGLETLHLCQLAEQPEDSSLDIMRDILVEAAPSLKNLTYGQWYPGQNLSPCSFTSLSKRVQFTRLQELHFCWVEFTSSNFEAFLRTAAPTLRVLSLKSVDLREKVMSPLIPLEGGGQNDFKWTGTIGKEMKQAWRRVWNIIRDQLSLECLSMHKLGFCCHKTSIRDRFSHTSGRQSDVKILDAFYNGTIASISFHDWINNLEADPSFMRGKDLPGGKECCYSQFIIVLYADITLVGSVIGNFPLFRPGGPGSLSLIRLQQRYSTRCRRRV